MTMREFLIAAIILSIFAMLFEGIIVFRKHNYEI